MLIGFALARTCSCCFFPCRATGLVCGRMKPSVTVRVRKEDESCLCPRRSAALSTRPSSRWRWERMCVRLALGQVLGYGRYVEGAWLAVLLPEAPAADLVELLEAHDVGCVVETNPGNFVDRRRSSDAHRWSRAFLPLARPPDSRFHQDDPNDWTEIVCLTGSFRAIQAATTLWRT